jgi:radical SAM family RiPP maturation amino acid epimerase
MGDNRNGIPLFFGLPINKAGENSMEDVYHWVLEKRDEATLETIANIKRFNECLVGDHDFRNRLMQNPSKGAEIAREKGIAIDPYALSPVWENGFHANLSNVEKGKFPLIDLWADWIMDLRKFRTRLRSIGEDQCPDKRFIQWRKRQIARSDSQLGDLEKAITHPAVSFELSKGCTRGCWFCGLSAESFKGFFPYSEPNARLWQGVLTSFNEILGGMLQSGFCYWATEPSDNPDYLNFIKDFYGAARIFPQTTTAAPLKNLNWTRDLLDLHANHRSLPCRFSILDVQTLHKVHEAFTPRELLSVELIIHVKGSIVTKTRSGRIRQYKKMKKGENVTKSLGTIACVSGFLVNMVDQTLQLVSPCPASEKWPLGYRIHAREVFRDAHDFKDKLLKIIEVCMENFPEKERPVAFREDLEYKKIPGGFQLKNKFKQYAFKGQQLWEIIGNLVAEGRFNRTTLIDRLEEQGIDILTAISIIEILCEKGLINDTPDVIPS